MSTSHTDFLKHVYHQRLELNKLISLATDISQMFNGLKGIEQMDHISTELPEEIESFISQYISTIKDSSLNELKELIRSLDHRAQEPLRNILNLAKIEITRDMDHEEIEKRSKSLGKEVSQFEQSVYTAIGTRLYMKERGIEVPSFKCEIPINVIQENIRKLNDKEKILRIKVTEKIDYMLDEISVFINDPSIPKEIKEKVLETQACLLKNKEHVVSGMSISSINLMIDTIELESDDPEPDLSHREIPSPTLHETADHNKDDKNSLLKRFGIWVTTPMEVNWVDTKHYKN